jgi:hypothetical protein
MDTPVRRRVVIFVSVCWCVLAVAVPVHASGLPAGAHVHVARTFDAPAFERAITHSYHVTLNEIVAADVDRDGDIDVITASDGVVVFWVNDGQGFLSSSEASSRSSSLDGGAPAPVWDRGERDVDVASAQDDPQSVRLTGVYAHAPPLLAARRPLATDPALRVLETVDLSAPRAPPA